MKRRNFIAKAAMISAVSSAPQLASVRGIDLSSEPSLTVAHITDVHIRPEERIPERAIEWLKLVQAHRPDFYLNGGDSIHDASYDGVSREQVLKQWDVWDLFMNQIGDSKVYSCIGNHDPWWDVPNQEDPMYGKPYVVRRLEIPSTYYSFDQKNWHFIVLDGNHEGISLGEAQMNWLKEDLDILPAGTPTLIMSHFPITSVTNALVEGQHRDHKELKALFLYPQGQGAPLLKRTSTST